jgi:hypothetical protein
LGAAEAPCSRSARRTRRATTSSTNAPGENAASGGPAPPRAAGAERGRAPLAQVGGGRVEESEELGGREKGAAAQEVAVGREQRRGRQAAEMIAPVDVGPRVGVHAHRHRDLGHPRRHPGIVPGLLVHPMAGAAPARGEGEQERPARLSRAGEGGLPPVLPAQAHGGAAA